MTVERLERYAFKNGLEQGAEQKAVENAITAIKEFHVTPEIAAQQMGAPIELVLEALKEKVQA